MRTQSSKVSEASAAQINSCSHFSEQKTLGYCEVDLRASRLLRQQEHNGGIAGLASAQAILAPSPINVAAAVFVCGSISPTHQGLRIVLLPAVTEVCFG